MLSSISGHIEKLAAATAKKELKGKIIDFLKKNPNPTDAKLHTWAEKGGYDVHRVEAIMYELATAFVKGAPKTAAKKDLKGFVTDIEKDTTKNKKFRKVLYTGKHSQLVLMSLKPGEDIGDEVHNDVDQFFRIDGGKGKVIINGKSHNIKDGSAFIVPAGAEHNVISSKDDGLKIYSIYSPPNHEDKVIHDTKEQAEQDEEHFDGKTTE